MAGAGTSFAIDLAVNADGVTSAADQLDRFAQRGTAASSTAQGVKSAFTDASKTLNSQAKASAGATVKAGELGEAFGKIGGPLGTLGQKAFGLKGAWDKLGGTLGAAGPYGFAAAALAAVAASVAVVTAAVVVGIAKVAEWAIGLADVARTNSLLAQGMVQSVKGGEALNSAIDQLVNRVPQTRDEIAKMAGELAKTGLRGKALTDTLEENAIAAAKLKFGPEWQKQMLSLDVQQRKFKTNLDKLFSGLKIDKLLEGLSSLGELFDENMASGQAIKVVFESIFQPITDGAAGMIPKIRSAFLQFEILALKALIAIKPWGSTIVKVGEVIAVVAAVMVGLFAAAIGVVIGLVGALVAMIVVPIALFAALAAGIVYAGVKIYEFGKSIMDTLSKVSLLEIGKQLIAGLAAGISQGVASVVTAVTGVADGAVGAAKKALGIASPSKVFAEIGVHTAAGMEQGIDAGASGVGAAMTDLATPGPAAPAAAGAQGSGASAPAGGSTTYQITINASSGAAQDIAEALRAVLAQVTEGAAVQLGAGVPA